MEEIKMAGLLAVRNAIICFKNCKVSRKNLLGIEDQGQIIAYSVAADSIMSVAPGCIELMEDCLVKSIAYSEGRIQRNLMIAKKVTYSSTHIPNPNRYRKQQMAYLQAIS